MGWLRVNDRVSRYWQVFKFRHQQSVLTAAALHSLNTHTQTHTKGKCMKAVQKLQSPSSHSVCKSHTDYHR